MAFFSATTPMQMKPLSASSSSLPLLTSLSVLPRTNHSPPPLMRRKPICQTNKLSATTTRFNSRNTVRSKKIITMATSEDNRTLVNHGRTITILSIDGGGIRGVIPSSIIEYLESKLQELDGEDARIADYFDLVAGTSTGGLVSTILVAPDSNGRPLFAGKDLIPFYLEHCPSIFEQKQGWMANTMSTFNSFLFGPKYDGNYLRSTIKDLFGKTKLRETITNLVIPTFDIKTLQPVIFSTFEAKREESKDALLSDICISTSAAPTFLPSHYFETKFSDGTVRPFDLIDGGVAANNPTMLAMTTISKEILLQDTSFFSMKPVDYDRFLVISIGTGAAKNEKKFSAPAAAKWGSLSWLFSGGSTPLIECFNQASADLVDIHACTLFKALGSENQYLRIQEDTLVGSEGSVDIATKDNLNRLKEIGDNLLKKPLSRVNLETGDFEVVDGKGTNADELDRFAKMLSAERKLRQVNALAETVRV